MRKKLPVLLCILMFYLSGCAAPAASTSLPVPTHTPKETKIPSFDHIVVIMFENRSYSQVIGSDSMPTFNTLADQNVLFTNYYAVSHPSLPNYIALAGGDTFGIQDDCKECFIDAVSLPDLIEKSGRTWKSYQEDIPSPCYIGNAGEYRQHHNPFIYFDSVRTNERRCKRSLVGLDRFDKDLAAKKLPDFAFIMPNMCNSGHDCGLKTADKWLEKIIGKLTSSDALGEKYLIFVGFEEGKNDDSSCCGMPARAGGHVAALMISPQAKRDFKDEEALSHYSLLKTILVSWDLPALGYSANPKTSAILAPWE